MSIMNILIFAYILDLICLNGTRINFNPNQKEQYD